MFNLDANLQQELIEDDWNRIPNFIDTKYNTFYRKETREAAIELLTSDLESEPESSTIKQDYLTAMKIAADVGDIKSFSELLEKGSGDMMAQHSESFIKIVNQSDPDRASHLTEGSPMLSYLISTGANISSEAVIPSFIKYGSVGDLILIQNSGIDLAPHLGDGLCESVAMDSESRIRFFLDQGADPNHKNSLSLSLAVESCDADIVKILLEAGCNVQARDNLPLRMAIKNSYSNIIKELLNHGADPHGLDEESLLSCIHNLSSDIITQMGDLGANFHLLKGISPDPTINTSIQAKIDCLQNLGLDLDAIVKIFGLGLPENRNKNSLYHFHKTSRTTEDCHLKESDDSGSGSGSDADIEWFDEEKID